MTDKDKVSLARVLKGFDLKLRMLLLAARVDEGPNGRKVMDESTSMVETGLEGLLEGTSYTLEDITNGE